MPPCGGAVASEPTRSPSGMNARLGVRLTEDYTRRCRRLQPTRSGTEDDRKRTTTNRVYPPPSRAEALNFGRQADPGADRIACRPPRNARDFMRRESDARSIRPRNTHRLLIQTLTAFHGVQHPTTLAVASSDQHRVYRTRLCCAFRFSQPLDALLRPQPFRPCFMPVTPLGFGFQRFSLPGSELRLSAKPSLHVVVSDWARRLPGRRLPSPDFEGLRIQGIRTVRPELPGFCRPILS